MSAKKEYAGFWVRLFAGLLDLLFLSPILVVLFFSCGADEFQSFKISDNFGSYSYSSAASEGHFFDLITYAVSIFYVVYFITGKKQATLGKRFLGIYVGNPDGSKLSWQKALARSLASLLTSATCGLGFILLIFTKEKTALHDLICSTRVFHGKKND